MTHEFKIEETWEGDGTGGVMFRLPSGGVVFVSRWTNRGQPDKATPEDWADALAITSAIEAVIEAGSWRLQ